MATTTVRRKRFEALVRKSERMLAESPKAYRFRVGALGVFGYLVIFGLLAILAALLAGSIWLIIVNRAALLVLLNTKIIFALPVLIWFLCRALWVRFERPQGIPITAKDAPGLFVELAKMRETLELPRVHEVLITPEFNAAIAQTPRLGVLGWQRNTLILGMQLMLILSEKEMLAVVAHEAGHLSGNHSRFNGWIYRVRISWYRVMDSFDDASGFAAGLLAKFFDWYVPYFDAMSFALARHNEFEADAVSAGMVTPEVMASALVRTTVGAQLIDEGYWQPLFERANTQPFPVENPFSGIIEFRQKTEFDSERLSSIAQEALKVESDYSDTHPALRERLQSIGMSRISAFKESQDAAAAWLGNRLGSILADLDCQWVDDSKESWNHQYNEVQLGRKQYQELSGKPIEQLENLELWQLADLTEREGDTGKALEFYQLYREREPEDRDADLVIGRILLGNEQEAGLEHLNRATTAFSTALPACELAYAYFSQAGEKEKAHEWRLRGEAAIDQHELANGERASIDRNDEYFPAETTPEINKILEDQLRKYPKVTHAWLAQKRVEIAPEIPLFIIVFKHKGFGSGEGLATQLAEELELPGNSFLLAWSGEDKELAKKISESAVLLF